MTERDAFENRLRAALLRHVADGPTGFDALGFARVVAAKEPRRHGFAGTLTWRGVAVPRLAWTLLLLAALLAAMVAGMLFVGSQIQQKLPAVVPTQRPALNAAALAPTGIDVLTPDPGASIRRPGPRGRGRCGTTPRSRRPTSRRPGAAACGW
jgi:hypothetical protein